MERTEDVPLANQRKLQWILHGLTAMQLLYGLFLPENWRECFGPFARPMLWAARHMPAVDKILVLGAPENPDMVYGVLGLAAYMPPLYALCFAWYGLFDRTDPQNIRLIVGKPGACRIYGKKYEPRDDAYKYHRNWSLRYTLVYLFASVGTIAFLYCLPWADAVFTPGDFAPDPDDKEHSWMAWQVGGKSFFAIVGIYFCAMYTWLAAKLTANPLAFIVDLFFDSGKTTGHGAARSGKNGPPAAPPKTMQQNCKTSETPQHRRSVPPPQSSEIV